MAKFAVDVAPGASYEVEAPDENTAWEWANQTHSAERRAAQPPEVERYRKQLDKGKPLQIGEAGLGQAAYEVGETGGEPGPKRYFMGAEIPTLPGRKAAIGVGSGAHRLARAVGLQKAAELAGQAEPGAEQVLEPAVAGAGPVAKGAELLTEVAMTAPGGAAAYRTAAGAAPTVARGLTAATGTGAALGAATTPGGLPERAVGAGLGALGGGAGEVGGRVLARSLTPRTSWSPEAAQLAEEGVRVPAWKGRAGLPRTLAERGKALPLTGHAVRKAEQQAFMDVNRNVIEAATPPVVTLEGAGVRLSNKPIDETGQKAVQELAKRFDDAYGTIYAGRSIPVDDAFKAETQQLAQQVKSYHPSVSDDFDGAMREVADLIAPTKATQRAAQVSPILGPGGQIIVKEAAAEVPGHAGITADAVKAAIGSVDDRITDAYRQGNGALADSLMGLKQSLQGLRERGLPPGIQDAVKDVNKAYRVFLRYQDAMGRMGSVGKEAATPQQLLSAVRAQDRTKGKAAFSRGTALPQQEMLQRAQTVLGNELPEPGPGSAEKIMGMAALLNPKILGLDIAGLGATKLAGSVPTSGQMAAQQARAEALRKWLALGGAQTAGAALAD